MTNPNKTNPITSVILVACSLECRGDDRQIAANAGCAFIQFVISISSERFLSVAATICCLYHYNQVAEQSDT